jgi:hypothetical protein
MATLPVANLWLPMGKRLNSSTKNACELSKNASELSRPKHPNGLLCLGYSPWG